MKTTSLIGLLVVLTILAGLLLSLSNIAKQQRILSINSFEECKQAGYPIMESYPQQCMTPDRRTFTEDLDAHSSLYYVASTTNASSTHPETN